ncbi:MAG: GNAT family N-acetyltransferase [Pseudonocardiales bacterium]
MPEVLLRAPSAEDRGAVRALCAVALAGEDDPAGIGDLLVGVGGGGRPRRMAVGVFVDGLVVGVAAAGGRTRADGVITGHLDLIAVHPTHRRAGVGRALVGHVEQWAAGIGAAELWWGNDAPTYAWPGVDLRYPSAHGLAVGLGFDPVREATNMTVDLAQADLETAADELRLAGGGVRISRLDRSSVPGVLDWVATFGGTWAAEVSQAASREPVGCHVARRGDAWVGFACHGANRREWFGPMGTAPSERGQGVGAVLLRRCLADQVAAGLSTAQLAWVGPVSFYERTVGAFVDRRFTLYRKGIASG